MEAKGKFEVNDRGNQLIVYEVGRLELSEKEMNVGPSHMDLLVKSNELNSFTSDKLLRILKKHPGRDSVILYVLQSDGGKMRAELPVMIDSQNALLKSHLHELFGRNVWKAS